MPEPGAPGPGFRPRRGPAERGAGPRVHAGCAALPLYWVGMARVGLVGRWEPWVLGPTCMGRGQGLGMGSPGSISVSV